MYKCFLLWNHSCPLNTLRHPIKMITPMKVVFKGKLLLYYYLLEVIVVLVSLVIVAAVVVGSLSSRSSFCFEREKNVSATETTKSFKASVQCVRRRNTFVTHLFCDVTTLRNDTPFSPRPC